MNDITMLKELRTILDEITDVTYMLKELTIRQQTINQKIITVLRMYDQRLMEMETK